MPLKSIAMPGEGLEPHVLRLQGLRMDLLAGDTAGDKIDVADIRPGDVIVAALNNDAGTLTDIKAAVSIFDLRASGTLTLSGVVADDACTVGGLVYTFKAAPSETYAQVLLGTTDAASAANLAAAITARRQAPGQPNDYYATASGDVVTVKARAEGTAGNATTLVGSTHITASGETLAGGSATGGIKSSGDTNQIILVWYKGSHA